MDELFAKRLQELIKNSGYTYEYIANQLGYKSKNSIFKYANGQTTKVGPTTISKIALFFSVSPSWLAGFTDDKYYNIKK